HDEEPRRGPEAYESSGQIPRSGRECHAASSDAQIENVSRLWSHESLSDQRAQAVRLRPHLRSVVEKDRLSEVLPPAVLILDRPPELGLGLPCRGDAGPVLGRPQDVLGLRE